MKLTVLGCGPSFQNPSGASSGYLLSSGDTTLLLECGHGVVGKLRAQIRPADLTACVVSHMHPDHIFDLVPLAYSYFLHEARDPVLPLFLPPGGGGMLRHLAEAAGLVEGLVDRVFAVHEYDPHSGLNAGGISIRFAAIQHFVEGYSMYFGPEPGLVYSSDTGWSERLIDFSRGASTALYEATFLQDPGGPASSGHLTAENAGKMARQAGVGSLLLTHYAVEWAKELEQIATEAFGAKARAVIEGTTYDV